MTNAAGCSTDGAIRAVDNRPIVDLGTNLTICQNTPVAPLDAQNPDDGKYLYLDYKWCSSRNRPKETKCKYFTAPGVFEYEVRFLTAPVRLRTRLFIRSTRHQFSHLRHSRPRMCGADDGRIDVNITGPADAIFSYFITGPTAVPSGTDQGLGPIPTAQPLAAGTYGITIADQVTGCASINTATVNDNAFTITP